MKSTAYVQEVSNLRRTGRNALVDPLFLVGLALLDFRRGQRIFRGDRRLRQSGPRQILPGTLQYLYQFTQFKPSLATATRPNKLPERAGR